MKEPDPNSTGSDHLSSSLIDAMRTPGTKEAAKRYLSGEEIPDSPLIYDPDILTLRDSESLDRVSSDIKAIRDRVREMVETTSQLVRAEAAAHVKKESAQFATQLEAIDKLATQLQEHSQQLQATVILPPHEELSVRLVTSNSLERLDEYRSDVNNIYLLIGIFSGAILGILSNWMTNKNFTITRPSIVLMSILLVLTLASIAQAFKLNQRAKVLRDRMLNPPSKTTTQENPQTDKH